MSNKVYWKLTLLSVFLFTVLTGAVAVSADEMSQASAEAGSSAAAQMQSPAASNSCSPVVTGNRSGLNGTTHPMAFDGTTGTYFESSYNDWQYIQIDFNCEGIFYGLRRHMTRDGDDASGDRWIQGEGVSYSLDGVTWTQVTDTTSSGWQVYTNYAPHAWHSIEYGWTNWLNLNTPAQARYIRFNWDGNYDAVNEIQVSFEAAPPLDVNLHCDAGGGRFICDAFVSGGSGSYSYSWRITSGNANITQIINSGSVSTALGTCQVGRVFGIEVTARDGAGQVATDRLSSVKCYYFMP